MQEKRREIKKTVRGGQKKKKNERKKKEKTNEGVALEANVVSRGKCGFFFVTHNISTGRKVLVFRTQERKTKSNFSFSHMIRD